MRVLAAMDPFLTLHFEDKSPTDVLLSVADLTGDSLHGMIQLLKDTCGRCCHGLVSISIFAVGLRAWAYCRLHAF